jgi:hypothetical protein
VAGCHVAAAVLLACHCREAPLVLAQASKTPPGHTSRTSTVHSRDGGAAPRRCEHRPQACSDYWDAAGRQVFINGSTASGAATTWPASSKLQVWPTQVLPPGGTPP